MLTYHDIFEIINKIENMYYKYRTSYVELKNDFSIKAKSFKYSAGGAIYPFGKYFIAEMQKKEMKKGTGRYCKDREKANFIYGFSDDKKLITICQIFKDTYIWSTRLAFLIYIDNDIYIVKFNESCRQPTLSEIGLIFRKNNFEYIIYANSISEKKENSISFYFDIFEKDSLKKYEYAYHLRKDDLVCYAGIKSEEEFPYTTELDISNYKK